jgi:adenylyltransferase/sulfurtransferase
MFIAGFKMKILSEIHFKKSKEKPESYTDRQERIDGWDQTRMASGSALVVGAGALGNEVIKNLVLMGIGYIFLADFDQVERSNLSRTVLLRRNDVKYKRFKAEAVAARARSLSVNREIIIQTFLEDIVWRLGMGVYRRMDVVIGCLDNVEARLAVNKGCLMAGTPYIDGAIYGLAGNVVAVNPPETACWECGTPQKILDLRHERYDGCWKVMDQDFKAGKIPTVQVASSIIAGFQTQEAVKVIQGQNWAKGTETIYSAKGSRPILDNLNISPRADCWCRMVPRSINPLELEISARNHTLVDLIKAINKCGYENSKIIFPDAFVLQKKCNQCGQVSDIFKPKFLLNKEVLKCSFCGTGIENIELICAEDTDFPKERRISKNCQNKLLETNLYELGIAPLGWIPFFPSDDAIEPKYVELSLDIAEVLGKNFCEVVS